MSAGNARLKARQPIGPAKTKMEVEYGHEINSSLEEGILQ
jgi:hypothetical protein